MIEVKNLTKYYGDHKAVNNLSFVIKDGTVCGFLGPNGAGKSTTMNMMTGCLSATEGTVSISDFDIFENPVEAKKMIGYLPEQPPCITKKHRKSICVLWRKLKNSPCQCSRGN